MTIKDEQGRTIDPENLSTETEMKHLKCGDLFPGCPAELHMEHEEDILAAAAAHAAEAHGLTELDEATVGAVRGAIRSDA